MTFVTLEVWKIGFTLSSKYVFLLILEVLVDELKFLLTNCQQLIWLFKILDAKSYKTDPFIKMLWQCQ